MKLHPDIRVFGDKDYRGACPAEELEQVTFFNRLRREFPETWGRIGVHPRNEGMRTMYGAMKEKAEGLTKGAADIIIPGRPAFVCELKRRDHTKSSITEDQVKFLLACQDAGCFVCIALGADAAWEAFRDGYLAER